MAFVLADWSITRNVGDLDLRYIGAAHTGAATSEAQSRVGTELANQIIEAFQPA